VAPNRRVALDEIAIADLTRIADYIIETSGLPRTAQAYIDRIEARCRNLADFPLVGRNRSDVGPDLRSLPFESVLIVYRVELDIVRILRVLGQAQDYEKLLRQLRTTP
jgi:toxin ParE1/3/4